MRESFKFYQSYLQILKGLDPQDGYLFAVGIAEFALKGKPPKFKKTLAILFEAIKPNILADLRRYDASVANSRKGGAPKGNQNASKIGAKNPKNSDKMAVLSQNGENQNNLETTYEQPKNNLETTKNNPKEQIANSIASNMHAKNNKNILSSLLDKERAKTFSLAERKVLLSDVYEYHKSDDYGQAMLEVADTLLEVKELAQQGELKFNKQTYTLQDCQEILAKQGKELVGLIAPKLVLTQDIKNKPLYILGIVFDEYNKTLNKTEVFNNAM